MVLLNSAKKNLRYTVALIFSMLLCTCGLDTFYYLDPPVTDGHTAYYTASDPLTLYFSFITNEESSLGDNYLFFESGSDFSFLGTEVYYKIYNNYSTMVSVENSINSLNSSSSNYSQAAESLIESRGYKPLKLSRGNFSPLIQAGGSPQNRHVYIRLNDYGTETDYQSGICVGTSQMSKYTPSSALTYAGSAVYPRRFIDSKYGFNFGKDDDNPVPANGDSDVYYTSASEEGVWYVDMYAISIGRDSSYSTSYSKVLFLGSIKISEDDYK